MNVDPHPVRREYDRLASDYDRRWRPYIDATMQAALEGVSFSGDEHILDAPCGTGELERLLLSKWPDLTITGVDISPCMLQVAKNKDHERRVTWIEADIEGLPLPDHSFDMALCVNSFHYFRSAESSLQEFRRVLRPGGTFVLIDWCDDYLACKLCSLWLRWTDPAFCRTYTLRACRSMLESAGMKIVRAERLRINWMWGLMRFVCHRAD
jgi:ubiquinone/menaquinone biosynthesis C-methylase UbiE